MLSMNNEYDDDYLSIYQSIYISIPLFIHLSISGRDPRARGVATVGAVLEEGEEDVIYEYEYYDDDKYDYVKYLSIYLSQVEILDHVV